MYQDMSERRHDDEKEWESSKIAASKGRVMVEITKMMMWIPTKLTTNIPHKNYTNVRRQRMAKDQKDRSTSLHRIIHGSQRDGDCCGLGEGGWKLRQQRKGGEVVDLPSDGV